MNQHEQAQPQQKPQAEMTYHLKFIGDSMQYFELHGTATSPRPQGNTLVAEANRGKPVPQERRDKIAATLRARHQAKKKAPEL